MATKYEEYYDRYRDEVSDYTDDELSEAFTRLDREPTPLGPKDRAKKHAIIEEAADR